MRAIQKDTPTHLCIQLMNKDTHKTLVFSLKCQMASHTGRLSNLLPDCVLTPEYSHLVGDMC